jgi:hypothetical protein
MQMLIRILLIWILLFGIAEARSVNVVVGGLPVTSGGACSGTPTLLINGGEPADQRSFADWAIGQSFTATGHNLHSIAIYHKNTTTGTVSCRIGTTSDLSSTYSEQIDITVGSSLDTWYTGNSTTCTTLTSGTWYVACQSASAVNIGVDDGGPISGGQYYYGTAGTYATTNTVEGRDMAIRIYDYE